MEIIIIEIVIIIALLAGYFKLRKGGTQSYDPKLKEEFDTENERIHEEMEEYKRREEAESE